MTKHAWIYSIAALTLILILGGTSYVAGASSDISQVYILDDTCPPPSESPVPIPDDGADQLPQYLLASTYSTLLQMGVVKPVHLDLKADPNAKFQPKGGSPQSNVSWSPEYNASGLSSSDEPDGNLHPTNPANMLISGNISLDTTTDGGSSWHSLYPPWDISNTIDVVAAFAPASPNQDTAIAAGLINCTPYTPCQIAAGHSTNRGVTWDAFSPTNLNSPGYDNDRPDLWFDNDLESPIYGRRLYLTKSLSDPARTRSYNTVVTEYSTDNGQSWSSFFVHDNTGTFYTDGDKSFGSMGFGPNGAAYVGWMASRCCGSGSKIVADVPTKHKWARSTDGGVTFPSSGIAATDPLLRSIIFNSYSPAGFSWSAQTDIGIDPVDGTMYMTWLRFRRDIPEGEGGDGAAVYITSSTNGGATWSTPTPVYDDPDCHATQYFPWVEVSKDHAVHVTYTSDVGGSRTTLAHFYTQSTDRGQTWSTPYQLSSTTYAPDVSFMGDYQQADTESYDTLGVGKILATWTDTRNGREHYARVGTFPLPTSTPTPTATPGTCPPGPDYSVTSSTSSIVPGTTLVAGSRCDNCVAPITLPFPFTLYGSSGVSDGPQGPQSFTSAWVSSNGNLQFETQLTNAHSFGYDCPVPISNFGQTIFAYWGDLRTDSQPQFGVFTSTSGNAPNRIFNIEWRACQKDDNTGGCTASANFEIRLYEGQSKFDLFYNALTVNKDDPNNPNGTNGVSTNPNVGYKEEVVVGVQQNASHYTPFACDTPGAPLYSGTLLTFTRQPYCPPPTNTPRPTSTPTFTPTPTATCPLPPTPDHGCSVQFTDVPPGSTLYPYVHCLACLDPPRPPIIDGYPCGGPGEPCDCYNSPYYRPGNDVWRGQLSKIVVLARLLSTNSNGQLYQDIPPGSTFYDYVNTLTNHTPQVVNGYDCGGQDEPCVPPNNLPYFRPNNPATRGQTAKMVLLACDCPQASRHFQDVAPGSTFYNWVERLAQQGAVSGYACGGLDEPCVPPGNLPYYRPNNVTSRGQAAQIIKISVYPSCPYTLSLPGVPGSLPQASATAQQTATVPPPTLSVTPGGTSTVVTGTGTPTTPTLPTGSPTPQETVIVPSPWPTVPLPIPTGYIPPPIPTVPGP